MEIKEVSSDTTSLCELFDQRNKYIIPGYQRPYEWGEEHIESLIDTLIKSNDNDSGFCLFGTVQFNKISQNEYEIIDGQQRMVSFWLLIKILNEHNVIINGLSFNLSNHISEKYNIQFNSLSGKYGENYQIIKDKLEKRIEPIQFINLYNYIINKVVFVAVYTDFSGNKYSSIEKTLNIFDALNTKGLRLETKDVFKIKYYDYLSRNTENNKDIFQSINNAYNDVLSVKGECYKLSPDDLIDSFRFWILANRKNEPTNQSIKGSFKDFFFGNSTAPFGDLNIDSVKIFCNLAKTMKECQECLKELDIETGKDIMLLCAKELLEVSGYYRIRNIFYVFVHAQTKGKPITKEVVLNALEMTQLVWKLCLIYHCRVGEIVLEAFEFVFNKIVREYVKSPNEENKYFLEKVKEKYEQNSSWLKSSIDEFEEYINGNIFESKRRWLMCFLSYINDCTLMNDTTAYAVKQKAYYDKSKKKQEKWEIEHIASQSLFRGNEEFVDERGEDLTHKIGNLVFLPANINKSLGHHSKTINSESGSMTPNEKAVEDFRFKVSIKQKSRNYHNAKDEVEGDRKSVV